MRALVPCDTGCWFTRARYADCIISHEDMSAPLIRLRCVAHSWHPLREMGDAPRNPAPRNHLLVGIAKPSGCHCTDALGRTTSVECRPLLGIVPLSLNQVVATDSGGATPGRPGAALDRPPAPDRGADFLSSSFVFYALFVWFVYVLFIDCVQLVLFLLVWPRSWFAVLASRYVWSTRGWAFDDRVFDDMIRNLTR